MLNQYKQKGEKNEGDHIILCFSKKKSKDNISICLIAQFKTMYINKKDDKNIRLLIT